MDRSHDSLKFLAGLLRFRCTIQRAITFSLWVASEALYRTPVWTVVVGELLLPMK